MNELKRPSHRDKTLHSPAYAWEGIIGLLLGLLTACTGPTLKPDNDSPPKVPAQRGEDLLSNIRQLTFAGRRTGEGYFSSDGKMMVFQSERYPNNPFFQIYLMDMETGDTRHVSPGIGKTTCAWIAPTGDQVLFASTHEDPQAERKQLDEQKRRAAGKGKRYAWDYDETYDIYIFHRGSGDLVNVTKSPGYDAEGSFSPDGRLIVFASNRRAYREQLSEADAAKFATDKSALIDIYIMNADGTNVRQLTDTGNYDGGPFFSPDGKRICWRRFDEHGTRAEIWTMNADGSDQKQITRLGAMSWAPFYHPSGDHLIFTTNRHGFSNFELHLIDADGQSEPVRVTFTEGFDGLPVFTPDGRQLAWTTNRTSDGKSQIFIADWHDAEARGRLSLPQRQEIFAKRPRIPPAAPIATITQEDLTSHVYKLASPRMEGRLTGTDGEKRATQYVADLFERCGLQPAGDDGTYYQSFRFTAGVSLGDANRLVWRDAAGGEVVPEPNVDWRPLAFSQVGRFEPAPIVFAGYGIKTPPATGKDSPEEYDSYAHLDVRNKWVLALRYMPEDIAAERRQALGRFASLRYKAMVARDKGAKGLIVVSGPRAKVKRQLVPMSFDASLAGTSIPLVSITDATAQQWLDAGKKKLERLQVRLDSGDLVMGFDLPGFMLEAAIDIEQQKRTGRNVLARLPHTNASGEATGNHSEKGGAVLVGAHVDHLGLGTSGSSLSTGDEKDAIHYGADDNASGVAALLEIAQYLADQKRSGKLAMRRDILFAAWSGEELGLLGSGHYARHFFGQADDAASLYPAIIANVNMDMVGRYQDGLTLYGIGSSSIWSGLIERVNILAGLKLIPQNDSYVPSDATSFFVKGVPTLSAFTGVHSDYHTPGDTPDKINYAAMRRITHFLTMIVRSLCTRDQPPDYIPAQRPKPGPARGELRAYLGTVPDYSQSDAKGVKLSGVGHNGPAERAGLTGGDVIVELAGRTIENIYDYTYAIEALKIGQPVQIIIERAGNRIALKITPESRE